MSPFFPNQRTAYSRGKGSDRLESQPGLKPLTHEIDRTIVIGMDGFLLRIFHAHFSFTHLGGQILAGTPQDRHHDQVVEGLDGTFLCAGGYKTHH